MTVITASVIYNVCVTTIKCELVSEQTYCCDLPIHHSPAASLSSPLPGNQLWSLPVPCSVQAPVQVSAPSRGPAPASRLSAPAPVWPAPPWKWKEKQPSPSSSVHLPPAPPSPSWGWSRGPVHTASGRSERGSWSEHGAASPCPGPDISWQWLTRWEVERLAVDLCNTGTGSPLPEPGSLSTARTTFSTRGKEKSLYYQNASHVRITSLTCYENMQGTKNI